MIVLASCRSCGLVLAVDEDGCCAHCGRDLPLLKAWARPVRWRRGGRCFGRPVRWRRGGR